MTDATPEGFLSAVAYYRYSNRQGVQSIEGQRAEAGKCSTVLRYVPPNSENLTGLTVFVIRMFTKMGELRHTAETKLSKL